MRVPPAPAGAFHGYAPLPGTYDECFDEQTSFPRVVTGRDWERVGAGLEQRITALDAFLADLYGEGRILAEKALLRSVVEASKGYLRALDARPRPREAAGSAHEAFRPSLEES